MPMLPGSNTEGLLDGEGFPIYCESIRSIRNDAAGALAALRAEYGDALRLLPISAASAAGGIFQQSTEADAHVVGLRLEPPPDPQPRRADGAELTALELDAIVIDAAAGEISVGAAVTLEQINLALARELGPAYRVPGADLTSYQYAAAGATFMTGGMGPQRRYFSDSVSAIAINDGRETRIVEGEALRGYAGSYGWTGLVTALRCRYYRFPPREISFALPVSARPEALAALLARLAPLADLRFDSNGKVVSRVPRHLILGIEHASLESMTPLIDSDGPQAQQALSIGDNCRAAGADGVLFITGLSDAEDDEFVAALLDDPEAEAPTLAGIALSHAELFPDGEAMRLLREAIPYAARMQAPGGDHVYKNHSDANIRLEPEATQDRMAALWRTNQAYVERVRALFEEMPAVRGEILVYGHLNPYGVDPHNRVTVGADDAAALERCRAGLVELRARYYRELAAICGDGAEFIGGEKTADSEIAIFAALGGPENAPEGLRHRFERRREAIAAAPRLFNWRAPAPFGGVSPRAPAKA